MATRHIRRLQGVHQWIQHPIVVSAPMRHIAGPELALAVSAAGGIGFMCPQVNREALFEDLRTAQSLLRTKYTKLAEASRTELPIGVGFLLWGVELQDAVDAVREFRPSLVWLYGGHGAQAELDEWSSKLRAANEEVSVWHMIGTLEEARQAISSPQRPDVLVMQGSEAGGHGRAVDGSSWTTLLPEAADLAEEGVPMIAAGGISDGRGVAAALAIGAVGSCVGTRFLASKEARLSAGYQQEVIRATDGATSTTRALIWNHLMGNYSWPKHLEPRGITNKTFTDLQAGVPFEELQRLHDSAKQDGDKAWGPEGRAATYAGIGVGLVREVKSAADIVADMRMEALEILRGVQSV